MSLLHNVLVYRIVLYVMYIINLSLLSFWKRTEIETIDINIDFNRENCRKNNV